MTRGGINILGSFLASLLLANNVHEVQCGISISAAAASGANYALGGGGGQPQFRDEESDSIEAFSKPTPVKPKKPNNENSVRKGRDVRTKCDVCLGEGSNTNLVRYKSMTL